MKRYLFFTILATMISSLAASAQSLVGMPKGKFVSYNFRRGGGMNPMNFTIYHLRYDDETGKPLLSISGECPGEVITMEVGQEVFDHCLELIGQHKLYLSTGFYQPTHIIHDAPSSRFSVTFKEPYKSIDGSGEMPDFIWDGLNAIHDYFKSVVGDRKAEGHVDRDFDEKGLEELYWTDGVVTISPSAKPIVTLQKAVRGVSDDSSREPSGMGHTTYRDGDQHFVMIHDYTNSRHHLYYSFDGKSVSQKQMALKHQVMMLSGTYKDAAGRLYVFDAEGRCQGPNGKTAKPFIVFPNTNNARPQYFWNNKVVAGYKLTADGIDILAKPAAGSKSRQAKTLCHLVRANNENEPWPIVNQRFLSQAMMDAVSLEQLKQMLGSIQQRSDSPFSGPIFYTDIGEVNQQMLDSEIKDREKK